MASQSKNWSVAQLRALATPAKPSKYGNKRVVKNGEQYRSKREAARHFELLLLQRAGKVENLNREVPFVLAPSVRYSGKRATPALRYYADFVYTVGGVQVVEDAKGMKTDVYKLKKHLMLSVHGIEVLEI